MKTPEKPGPDPVVHRASSAFRFCNSTSYPHLFRKHDNYRYTMTPAKLIEACARVLRESDRRAASLESRCSPSPAISPGDLIEDGGSVLRERDQEPPANQSKLRPLFLLHHEDINPSREEGSEDGGIDDRV